MITSPDHARTGFTLTCLIESWNLIDVTLFFPPLTCRIIASSTQSSQQRHEPMPASLTDQLGLESLVKLGQRSTFLLKLVLSPRCVSTFLEVRKYLPDTSHASCRCCSLLRPPAVVRFFRSLAARQGRCQPHFSVLDWDFSKLFEHDEIVIQQKMRLVLQLDMKVMTNSTCLIEFNIYKEQKKCEHTSKCLVHRCRQDL